MQDVLKALPAKEEGNSLRLATILFIRWMTQIHQMNTASLVGADADLPVYDVGEDFLFDTLNPPKRATLEATSKIENVDPISVRLPSLDWLLHEGADTAIQVRNEYGVEYLAALARWQRNPSEEAFDDVKNTISAYCANICRGANVTFDGWLSLAAAATMNSAFTPFQKLSDILAKGGGSYLDYALVVGSMLSAINSVRPIAVYAKKRIKGLPRRQYIQLTLPAANILRSN
jgi:hypothetical protein